MICPGDTQHVGDQLCTDWCPRLVLLVLPSIGKAWDYCGYSLGRRDFAGVYHNQEFHEIVINLSASRLNDINIFATDGFANFYTCFQITEFLGNYLSGIDT
jgi:hypothetical protein